MTISYNLDVATASPLNFFRLIFRWKASIWKVCLKELCIWTILFLIISLIYKSLSSEQKTTFEKIAYYLNSHLDYIPLTFMLGFFVQIIVQRWSVCFQNMGYVESPAIYIGGYVYGTDDDCRLLRRTMARYLCLTQLLVFRDISVRVRKRFPTYDSIVQAGFMLEHEKEKLLSIRLNYDKYWVPINWIYALIFRSRKDGKVPSDSFANKLCDEIKYYRASLQMLCNYDWVPIPLAYPQLVFLAVYVYFGLSLICRQFIVTETAPNKSSIDATVPFMTMMEFLIFIGWMKVAEGLLNPFGDDDDDFECNYLLDKNLATSLCIVDDASNDVPLLMKDQFWLSGEVEQIYSKETLNQPINPLVGSATHAHLSDKVSNAPMVVRKSADVSSFDAAPRKSLSSRISEQWRGRLFSVADVLRHPRRSRGSRKYRQSEPALQRFHSDVAIHRLEDGVQTDDDSLAPAFSPYAGRAKRKRQFSVFTVLDGRTESISSDRGSISYPPSPTRTTADGVPSVFTDSPYHKSGSIGNVLSTVEEEEDQTGLPLSPAEDSSSDAIDRSFEVDVPQAAASMSDSHTSTSRVRPSDIPSRSLPLDSAQESRKSGRVDDNKRSSDERRQRQTDVICDDDYSQI